MTSAKKLFKLARKWKKHASIKQRKITLSRMSLHVGENDCCTSSIIEKDHLVVYSADQKHFMLLLEHLKEEIARDLFKLAEEEFGIPSNGPLRLPYDAVSLQYVISLKKWHPTEDVEKALFTSIASGHCLLPIPRNKKSTIIGSYLLKQFIVKLCNYALFVTDSTRKKN